MRELLEELLRSYRNYYIPLANDEFKDNEEKQQAMNLAMKAWETLQSLFPAQQELDEEYLSQQADDSERAILEEMEKWAIFGLVHRPGGPNFTRYSVFASGLNDYKHRIDQLTDSPGDTPAIWPFIKLIRLVLFVPLNKRVCLTNNRVYLDSPVLRTGLVLADLPGGLYLSFINEQELKDSQASET